MPAVLLSTFLIVKESGSVALIDFRTLLNGPTSEAACRDAVDLAAELARSAIVPSEIRETAAHELRCRLYGGFRDRIGNPTPEYHGLLAHIEELRGLDRGVRTIPEIALNVLDLPKDDLVGTYRKGGQKMVDTAIAADASKLANQPLFSLTIVSNDDDFVPVLLAVAHRPMLVQWLRRPRAGDNDALLRREGIVTIWDPAWP